jgi:hypothetical protein
LAAHTARKAQRRAGAVVTALEVEFSPGVADVEQLRTAHSSDPTERDEYTLGTVYSM